MADVHTDRGGEQYRMIDVGALVPTKDNPRTFRRDDAFKELVNSVRDVGIIQPLIARPIGDNMDAFGAAPEQAASHAELFDLRAGHRRLQAAIAAGLPQVPVIVREMDDVTARLVTVTENKDRQDLTPIEESRSVKLLLECGLSPVDVADKLGKTPQWVARRAKLTELTEKWLGLFENEKSIVSEWPASMLEEVARLAPAAQDELAGEVGGKHGYEPRWVRSPGDLRRMIEQNFLHHLSAAPWSQSDAELLPAAGACNVCPKRSAMQPLLFADLGTKKQASDRCLDVSCFAAKREAHTRAKFEAAQRQAGVALPVLHNEHGFAERAKAKTINTYEVAICKAADKGAKPAFDALTAKLVYIRPTRPSGNGLPAKVDARDAREVRTGKRMKHVLDALVETIDKASDADPTKLLPGIREFSIHETLTLALIFGVDHNWSQRDAKTIPDLKAGKVENTSRQVLQSSLGEMSSQCAAHNSVIAKDRYPRGKVIAELLKIDFKALEAAALVEIPEPKTTSSATAKPKSKQKSKKR